MFSEKINNLISDGFKLKIKSQNKLGKNVLSITLTKNKISYKSIITGIISDELFFSNLQNLKERFM